MLNNKVAVISGLYNNHSIAYGIFKQFIKEKAEVVCLVQSSRIKERVENIIDKSLSKSVLYNFKYEYDRRKTKLKKYSLLILRKMIIK